MRAESADGRSKQERGGPRRLQAGERETTKDRDAGTGERRVKNKAGARESQTGSWGAGSLRDARSKNPGSCDNPARGSQGHVLVSCPGRKVKSTKSRVIGILPWAGVRRNLRSKNPGSLEVIH